MTSKKYLVLGFGLGVVVVCSVVWFNSAQTAPASPTMLLTQEQLEVRAVRSVKPAVVSIVGSKKVAGSQSRVDAIFGTGFILTPDGYIATNGHVVKDNQAEFRVELLDGKALQAKVVGVDSLSDIALLKVQGESMATIKYGSSDALETGQTVFAIGNALGKYQHTVTRGVVAGLGRDVNVENTKPRLRNLIQTDAAINPGNSGGPLVNTAGEVVGMNTVLEGGTGLGFAIPSSHIVETVELLKGSGSASRPYLGVSFLEVTPFLAEQENLKVTNGALVVTVSESGPAYRYGIQKGDVILSVNKRSVTKADELDELLQTFQAGAQILLEINRNGQKLELPVILAEFK